MSIETWGDKPESQISARLVLEAIADLITSHEADPDAHLEVGESLQSHKASEIIDHLASSVLRDKLEFDRYSIDCDFQTVDEWLFFGGCAIERINELQIFSSGSIGDIGYSLLTTGDAFQDITSFAKSPNWQVRAYFEQASNFIARLGMFDEDYVSGIGFKISVGNLYAVWFDEDDVEQTEEILSISATTPYLLRFNYDYATSTLKFYVNGALVHTVIVEPATNVTHYGYFSLEDVSTIGHLYYISNFHYDSDN